MFPFKNFVSILFLLLFCLDSNAQERVSNYEQYSQIETIARNGKSYKLHWNDINYIVTSSGNTIKLQDPSALDQPPIVIETEMNCGSFHKLNVVNGDFLYVGNSYEIQEIDLIEEKSTRRFSLREYGSINSMTGDNQNGIICEIFTAQNIEKEYVRIDLSNGQSSLTILPPSHSVIHFQEELLVFSSDSTVLWSYNLAENSHTLLTSGTSLRPILSIDEGTEVLFTNSTGQIFSYDSNNVVAEKCFNQYLNLGVYDKAFYDDKYIYKQSYSEQHFGDYIFTVHDKNTCVYHVAFSGRNMVRSPIYTSFDKNEYLIFQFAFEIVMLDLNTLEVDNYNTSTEFVYDIHVDENNYYFIWENSNERFEITKIDLRTGASITHNTMEAYALFSYSNLNLTTNDSNQLICTGHFDNQHTSIVFDNDLNEVNRYNIGQVENFGLILNTPDSWKYDNEMIYSQQSRTIHIFKDGLLEASNDYRYHPSPILKDKQVFGFINMDNSTFFTKYDIEADSLHLVKELPFVQENYIYNLYSLNEKIYQLKQYNKLVEFYPNSDAMEIEIPYDIRKVYHQANDKVLVKANIEGIYKLAWFDGEQFDVVIDEEVNSVNLIYQSWSNNTAIKILVFKSENGHILYSFDEITGEELILEEYQIETRIPLINNTSNKWKMMAFFEGLDALIIATNGKRVNTYDLSDLLFQQGWSSLFSYENDHLFFTNVNQESFIVDQFSNATNISDLVDDRQILEVIYSEDNYYFITRNSSEIVISEADKDLDVSDELARINLSSCYTVNDVQYLGKTDDEELVITIPSFEYGNELWSISPETKSVELVVDLNQSSLNGFGQVEFFNNSELYFTGSEELNNNQLYRLDVNNTSVSINEIFPKENLLKISPNPGTNEISFDTPLKNIRIINAQGKLVISDNPSQNTKSMNISSLSNGLYFITGQSKEGRMFQSPFVKI